MSRRGRWTRQDTWNLDWNKPKWNWWDVHPFYSTERWHALRRAVLERDRWTCRYCSWPAQTADHVIPRGAGGDNSMDNLVASCNECNRIA